MAELESLHNDSNFDKTEIVERAIMNVRPVIQALLAKRLAAIGRTSRPQADPGSGFVLGSRAAAEAKDSVNSAAPGHPSDVAASAALRQAVKAFAPKPAVAEPSAPVSAPSSAGQKRQVRPPKPQVPAPK